MKPPIFLVGTDGEALAFPSPGDVEHFVESVDVEDGEYAGAYDSEGRQLSLVVTKPTVRRRILFMTMVELTPVVLEEAESDPRHATELRDILVSALARIQQPASDLELPDLTAEAFRQFR